MTTQSYRNAFLTHERQVETQASLVWERFSGIRPQDDVLSSDFILPTSEQEGQGLPEDEAKELREIIQLGRLVSLRKRGLTEEQLDLYKTVREELLGRRVVGDYCQAKNGHGPYTPEEILEVAKEHGNFTEGFYRGGQLDRMLGFVDFLVEVREAAKETTPKAQPQRKDLESEVETGIPLTAEKRPLQSILELTSPTQIDNYLKARV